MEKSKILNWLNTTYPHKLSELYKAAYDIKCQQVGKRVFLRGLIEISNICRKNCMYCGIRSDNTQVNRYRMSEKEVLDAALIALELGYGSVVIQSGERQDDVFVDYIDHILKENVKILVEWINEEKGPFSKEYVKLWYDRYRQLANKQ